MATIRLEEPADLPAVRAVNEHAFNRVKEADLVDRLRTGSPDFISLVGLEDGRIVGHALFTTVTLSSGKGELKGLGLGPVAVLPRHQRQGVGSQLIRVGLELARERGYPFVIVLGHPTYYLRFGFAPASQCGILCPWPGIPDDVFMALVLDPSAMRGVSGVARYRDEFNAVM